VSFWIPVSEVWGTSKLCLDWIGRQRNPVCLLRLAVHPVATLSTLAVSLGRNPLVCTCCITICGFWFFLMPRVPVWHHQAPVWQVSLQAVIFISVLSGVALFLQRRRWIVSM